MTALLSFEEKTDEPSRVGMPGFHMLGKSQVIRGLTFCRPSYILPIYRIIAGSLSQRRHVYV